MMYRNVHVLNSHIRSLRKRSCMYLINVRQVGRIELGVLGKKLILWCVLRQNKDYFKI